MQHPTVQVIGRNEELFPDGMERLVIEPPACQLEQSLEAADILTFNYRSFQFFHDAGAQNVRFGLDESNSVLAKQYEQIILFMPKSKQELELYLDLAASCITPSGSVFLIGEKKSGIASGAKRLAQRAKHCDKIDSAKHCQLWQATELELIEEFQVDSYIEELEVSISDIQFKIATMPGVFANGRLDDATELLLSQKLKRLKGRTLDFGCGTGVIGAYLKLQNPEIALESIDINWFALTSTKKTIQLNGLEAKVYPSDGWGEVQGRVNGVVTNPPFHQGVSTEYETTEGFIREAYSKMARYAPMYIVANNFLRYPTLIESVFGKCTYYAKNAKFNVYYCER